MSILEVSRNLFEFFKDNSIFDIDKDFNKAVLISENDDVSKAIVRLALKDFEDRGIVKSLSFAKQASNDQFLYFPIKTNHWVLTKPIAEFSQTIELSYPTINAIASTINEICDELEVDKGKVNPLNVTEVDIQSLILIIQDLRKSIEENE